MWSCPPNDRNGAITALPKKPYENKVSIAFKAIDQTDIVVTLGGKQSAIHTIMCNNCDSYISSSDWHFVVRYINLCLVVKSSTWSMSVTLVLNMKVDPFHLVHNYFQYTFSKEYITIFKPTFFRKSLSSLLFIKYKVLSRVNKWYENSEAIQSWEVNKISVAQMQYDSMAVVSTENIGVSELLILWCYSE